MFKIVVDNTCIGVCAAPYASEGEVLNVGYILIDGSYLKEQIQDRGPGPLKLPEFNLFDGSELAYEQCRVTHHARSFYMTDQRGVLFEDSQVQFLWHHGKGGLDDPPPA